jgi:hypothetical protein
LSAITVPPGYKVELKSHVIQLDSVSIDSKLETIQYKWSWDSNVLFPSCHSEGFEDTITHLRNLTVVLTDYINVAVAKTKYVRESENKMLQQYFKELKE